MHFPAFEKLCERAEESGLQVRLAAGERIFTRREGEEYRQLTRIELWASLDRMPLRVVHIHDDDLEAAALHLLAAA